MFVNSVPNSDSEQCTESKLGWVHKGAHLTDPGCAHGAPRPHALRLDHPHCSQAVRALRRVVACKVSYRRPSTGLVAGPLGHIVAVSLCARARWADHIVAHQAPCRGLSRDKPSSQAALLSRYNRLYCDTRR